jgi:hypothetical protein
VHFQEFTARNNLSAGQLDTARSLAFWFYQNGLVDGQG